MKHLNPNQPEKADFHGTTQHVAHLTYRTGYEIAPIAGGYYFRIPNGPLIIFEGPVAATKTEAETKGLQAVWATNPTLARNTGLVRS